jgi:hypothetical protein
MIVGETTVADIKRIKTIKLIAKWFLLVESLLIISWSLSIHEFREYIFTANGWATAFAAVLFYIVVFWILTFSIVLKNPKSISVKSAKIKLWVIVVFVIIPAILMGLLLTFAILSK